MASLITTFENCWHNISIGSLFVIDFSSICIGAEAFVLATGVLLITGAKILLY